MTGRPSLEPPNFLQPSFVPLRARELGPEKHPDQFRGEGWSNHPGSEREHIHRVVLYALARREAVVAERRSNARKFVCRHRRADPAAAREDAARRPPLAHSPRDARREVRVVVVRVHVERAAIEHLVPSHANRRDNGILERKAGVVGSDGDNRFVVSVDAVAYT